jgi:hypothetical protein
MGGQKTYRLLSFLRTSDRGASYFGVLIQIVFIERGSVPIVAWKVKRWLFPNRCFPWFSPWPSRPWFMFRWGCEPPEEAPDSIVQPIVFGGITRHDLQPTSFHRARFGPNRSGESARASVLESPIRFSATRAAVLSRPDFLKADSGAGRKACTSPGRNNTASFCRSLPAPRPGWDSGWPSEQRYSFLGQRPLFFLNAGQPLPRQVPKRVR